MTSQMPLPRLPLVGFAWRACQPFSPRTSTPSRLPPFAIAAAILARPWETSDERFLFFRIFFSFSPLAEQFPLVLQFSPSLIISWGKRLNFFTQSSCLIVKCSNARAEVLFFERRLMFSWTIITQIQITIKQRTGQSTNGKSSMTEII